MCIAAGHRICRRALQGSATPVLLMGQMALIGDMVKNHFLVDVKHLDSSWTLDQRSLASVRTPTGKMRLVCQTAWF